MKILKASLLERTGRVKEGVPTDRVLHDPYDAEGNYMPPRSRTGNGRKGFTISYEIITPESAEDGEAAESGWEDEEGVDIEPRYPEDGETAVDAAVAYLNRQGVSEYSGGPNGWFTEYGEQDMRSGGYENRSFHPYGFTDAEVEEIAKQVTRR